MSVPCIVSIVYMYKLVVKLCDTCIIVVLYHPPPSAIAVLYCISLYCVVISHILLSIVLLHCIVHYCSIVV